MSLTIEEIQKTLMDSMKSMQDQMEIDRKNYNKKIKELETIIEEKEEIISELSKKKSKNIAKRNIAQEIEKLKKDLESKTIEYKSAMITVSTLNNQIELKKQNILQLDLEKRQLKEKLDDIIKQNNIFKNESPVLQKQIEEEKKKK